MTFKKSTLAVLVSSVMMGTSSFTHGSEQPSTTADSPEAMQTLVITGDKDADNEPLALEVEVDVSKMGVPVEELPLSVSVIDKEFMKEIGAKNIQDALLYSSGVFSGAFGFDTRGDWSKVRGVSPIDYVDGMKSLFGYYNNVRPNTYTLERIEVLKGPSSMLYGQSSVGGIQNAVTKKPQEEAEGELWIQGGSHDRKQFAGDYTGKLDQEGEFLFRVIGLVRNSGTQVDYVEDNEQLFNGSLAWIPNDDTTVTFILNHQTQEGQVSAQFLPSGGTINEHSLGYIGSSRFVGEPDWDRYDRQQRAVSLMLEHAFNETWSLDVSSRYTDASSETREHWADIGVDPDSSGNINRTAYQVDKTSEAFTFDARLNGNLTFANIEHKLTTGIDRQIVEIDETNYAYVSSSSTFNVFNPVYGNIPSLTTSDLNRGVTTKQLGIYVADHITIDDWIVTAALRRDKTESASESGTEATSYATTRHLGLMYQFDSGISPYVSYSESFTPNTGSDGTGGILAPTEGEQKEVGVKYLSADKDLAITAAVFNIKEKNRVSNGSTPGGLEQLGSKINGWEVQAKKDWDAFNILANLTVLDAKNASTDVPISALAEKTASVWGNYKFANGLRSGLGMRYQSESYGSGGSPEIPSVTLYDAMLGYTYGDWDFTVNAQNLTDEEYISWCRAANQDCGYGERRSIMVNAHYSF